MYTRPVFKGEIYTGHSNFYQEFSCLLQKNPTVGASVA